MILDTRPDVLPILYRGFPHHRRSEQYDHQPAVTPYDVPIFANVDGRISINFTYSSIVPALHELGRELSAEESDALEVLRDVLVDVQLELKMESGEVSIANNYALATHAPTSSTATAPTRAGWCSAPGPRSRPRIAGSPSGASSSTWRTKAVASATTRSRVGPSRSRRTTTPTSPTSSPTCSRPTQAKPKGDDAMSATATKRVAYFDGWTDPVVDELLADRPDIEPVRLELDGDADRNWRELTASHGYQCLIRTEAARRPELGDRWLANAELVDRCPSLLAVCSAGAGYDVIDVDACTAAGVIVCNNAGPGAEAVAEHALGFMLSLAKRIGLADRMIRRAPVTDRVALRGTELRGKTLGVVGIGRIGGRLVQLCEPFAMTVLAYDPYWSETEVEARGARAVPLDELLARSDFVCVTCPLTSETAGMFGPRSSLG